MVPPTILFFTTEQEMLSLAQDNIEAQRVKKKKLKKGLKYLLWTSTSDNNNKHNTKKRMTL